ncbi:hypothetical protein JM946_22585 [Steroidobacter sp. S1-65]|uniref:Uncharacterized protein n=1 Tax=Steroidobacter gossypii TaxID=2805490 RepID=A0ABS1X2T6_9GAMM|nr:hypothetical protein [Steroidobacter gossypii]MBM0107538.1 hypothetical protein [Steroidobacter gossypii]
MVRLFSTRQDMLSLAGAFALSFGLAAIPVTSVGAQGSAKTANSSWVVPRTADGKPDLQGNWSNETQTPLERLGNHGLTLSEEQAGALEQRAQLVAEFRDRPSDPNAPPPSKGGDAGLAPPGEKTFVERIAEAAGGAVGGYNGFWLDPGNKVIRIDGVARSSIIVDPSNGRIPPLTAEAKQRVAQRMALMKQFGEFDHPEIRPLGDRCITSFGSNAGPPMLPNYFYNNNYTIVQTRDHVMIMTEMNHDARIIRLNAEKHAPAQVRPWFGDSIGHWEGDTLVVETTNIHPAQLAQTSPLWAYRGASDQLKVTERFTRTGPNVLLYRFTVEDPSTFTAPFSGELPFNRIDELIHEYACHEGNYALPGILAGARAEEQAAAEKTL